MNELIEKWDGVTAGAAPEEADPVVLECARLLAAEPDGEQAVLLTFGLVNMARYVLGRRGTAVERAVVDALGAAAEAMDEQGRGCGHRAHPYTDSLEEWDTDADGLLDAPDVETPLDEWDEAEACPRNAAGWARTAADVILPGSTDGIPEIVPESHQRYIRSLGSVLNDYPNGDPFWDLDIHAGPPGDLSRAALAGYVVVAHANCWYAGSGRIRQRSLLDDMIEGLESVLPLLPDEACAHEDGEHPALRSGSEEQASEGIHLQSPGGRTVLREEHADGYGASLEAWTCTTFLRALAVEARDHLREAVDRLFGTRETAHLDQVYLRPDGRLDIDSLSERHVPFKNETASEEAALWAARRYEQLGPDGPALDRTVLLLLMGTAADSLELSYGIAREILGILRTTAATLPGGACDHADGHADGRERTSDRVARIARLYAPDADPAPGPDSGQGFSSEVLTCPVHLVEVVTKGIAEIEEQFEEELEAEEERLAR
ncbi:hypothetical protein PUR34_04290 [Streptomyces sp. JV185]|uniref:hypothetical protein n=1 Tax=Streptomyces sp. JV185 TaxID=858638 RepID=UPI002E76AA9B|nr:hypothetical protein [Streptomyces sp. JV185]MEE1767416.1 hypothetical protein [Streptomyces sp. JV185]